MLIASFRLSHWPALLRNWKGSCSFCDHFRSFLVGSIQWSPLIGTIPLNWNHTHYSLLLPIADSTRIETTISISFRCMAALKVRALLRFTPGEWKHFNLKWANVDALNSVLPMTLITTSTNRLHSLFYWPVSISTSTKTFWSRLLTGALKWTR